MGVFFCRDIFTTGKLQESVRNFCALGYHLCFSQQNVVNVQASDNFFFFYPTLCLPMPPKSFVEAAETTWKSCSLNTTIFSYGRSLNVARCRRKALREGPPWGWGHVDALGGVLGTKVGRARPDQSRGKHPSRRVTTAQDHFCISLLISEGSARCGLCWDDSRRMEMRYTEYFIYN